MDYTFQDHLHNYSVWTAARAVQRGFTNTENIKAAIEKTGLRILSENRGIVNSQDFDKFHLVTSKTIISHLASKDIFCSYGQAAKIIAIYLKTSIIIRDSGDSLLSKIIHPPIDRILLENLNRDNKNLKISKVKWTQLSKDEYFDLISTLRTLKFNEFWKLEKYWIPTG